MNRILLAITLFVFLCFSGFGQSNTNAQTISRIESYLDKLKGIGFSGSVLIELPGNTVFARGYGYSNSDLKIKNTPNTIFDIGSVTKQFTAAAILKLEMQGKLSTGDAITKYFANVPKDKSKITIHDLLRHQSGLLSVVGGDYDAISAEAFVDSVFKAPLKFETGTQFSYSNIGYSLLAMIIEKVSGLSYEEYLYENLWKPAHMEQTGYSRPKFDTALIATGYRRDGRAWGKPIEKAWDSGAPFWHLKGNGGILSTVQDMDKWDRSLKSETILSKEAKEKLYHPALRTNDNDALYYAYGWDVVKTIRNTRRVQHNGSNGIFYADLHRYIDEGITIIMLSNKAQRYFEGINFEIGKMIFNPTYTPTIPVPDNPANLVFTENIIAITLEHGLDAGIEAMNRKDNAVGLLEDIVNEKGYDLLSEKKFEQSINVFALNVYAFPQSANAYDSYAEAYMNSGNKELAIKYYTKSLELNPESENAKEMLKKLGQ